MDDPKFRFECSRCGKCCTAKDTLVNVTYQDIIRIKEGLKLSLEEVIDILGFYVFEKKPSVEELKKMIVPPIETENGLAFTGLRKKPSGKCYFYDDDGKKCSIYKLRPNFCKTFPFSFSIIRDKKEPTKAKIKMFYTVKSMEYCPGISKKAPLINESNLIKLGKRVIEEMGNNNIVIEKWNEAVKKGKIKPSARSFVLTITNIEEKKDRE